MSIRFSILTLAALLLINCSKDGTTPDTPPTAPEEKWDENLVVGGIVQASSFQQGQNPEYLVDGQTFESPNYFGSLNTSEHAGVQHEEWVIVSLNTAQRINEVRLYPKAADLNDGFPVDFRIEISDDGSTWKSVVERKNYPAPWSPRAQIFTFEPVYATQVRLYAEKLGAFNNNWTGYQDVYLLHLGEMEVYLSSASVERVTLGSNTGVAGQTQSLDVTILTRQMADGTELAAELVDAQGNGLSPAVKASGTVSKNTAKIALQIPQALAAATYRVAVSYGGEKKGLSEEYSLKALGGKSYYVSSSAGNDSNDGLSEQTPIKTLRQASKITLEPGDRLLFRRGDVWERESLFPKGSGTADIPIELGAYGSGEDRPWIKPGMTQLYGIRIVNTGGYRITGLEISNRFGGLVVWEENTYNHEYMWVEDCYFHDMTTKNYNMPGNPPDLLYGMGISIAGSDAYGGSTLLSDITIKGCEFDRCDVGIEVIGRDHDPSGQWTDHGHDKISCRAFLDVDILDCNIRRSYRSGGVMLYCITGGRASNVLVDQTGYEGVGMWWGVCAFQTARVSDYLVEDCTFSNTIKGTSPDGQGFDWESDVHNVTVRRCRFLNNEGPATLNYGGSWAGENTGCVLEDCYLEGNNRSGDGEYIAKVFGVGKPENFGIFRRNEIHLRTNDQNFYCYPIVFDESNVVFDADGNKIYAAPDRSRKLFGDTFEGSLAEGWINASAASIVDGRVKLRNKTLLYADSRVNTADCLVEDHVQFSEYGQTGLAFGVQDDRNYLLAKISVTRGKATGTICRVTNGSETTLNSFSVGVVRLDQEYWLRVEVKDGSVRFAVNGNVMGSCSISPATGSAGIWMGSAGACTMNDFAVYAL